MKFKLDTLDTFVHFFKSKVLNKKIYNICFYPENN